MKLLITGGAGYIGSAFLKYAVGAYDITVFDNLLHGGNAMVPYFSDVNFHFIKGDVRDKLALREAVKGKDAIIHLAAIVGLPACEADRRTAEETNYDGSMNLMLSTNRGEQRVVYASTVSVYGKVENEVCTERTYTRPLSHYGQTKLRAESALVEYGSKATAFRFPTVFGVSPRMRLDLMPNDLTFQAVKNGGFTVYEPDVRRTFIHVRDVVRALELGINRYETVGQIYNPGDESLNVTKRELAEAISKETGAKYHCVDVGHDGDQRDYEVSFEKIKKLGFRTSVTLEQGIREVAQASHVINLRNPYSNI